jgi:hypothetical protein
LVAGAMFLVIVIYGHPDDKSVAYFPKFVTVTSSTNQLALQIASMSRH